MDDLTQWLNEQLDEDERIARAASHVLRNGAHWSLDEWHGREQPHSLIAQGTAEQPVALGHFTADPVPTEQALHIAAHDPARVLREVEAKRRLLDIHRPYVAEPGQACLGCAGGIEFERCPVVRLLALPYADRPGYRDEWRP